MKTILINIFDHAVAKNIFSRGFGARLARAKDRVRLIIVVPERKLAEFSRELRSIGEVVPRKTRYVSLPEAFALFVARNAIPTHTVRQIEEEGLDGSGRLPLPKYVLARIVWLLGHSYLFRRFLKFALTRCFDTGVFAPILKAHKPDLVFATTTYAVDDVRLMRAARGRQIPLLGMVKSWDNFTSKDFMLVPPDRLMVHNEVVLKEAADLHRYPRARVRITGVPQFDGYADPSFPEPRESFFEKLGLNPAQKLVTYSAMGRWLVRHEWEIIAMLARVVREKLAAPAQLLVRLHPAYPDNLEELSRIRGIVIDVPGSPLREKDAWKADWKFKEEDVRHLATTLKWSNVLLNCGSTMMLDGACMDTPMIGIAFDGEANEPSYWRSARRLFEREHALSVIKTEGVRVVRNEEELVRALNGYLADPAKDREKRAVIVAEQTGVLDGRAGERLAEAMFSAVYHS